MIIQVIVLGVCDTSLGGLEVQLHEAGIDLGADHIHQVFLLQHTETLGQEAQHHHVGGHTVAQVYGDLSGGDGKGVGNGAGQIGPAGDR